MTKSLLYVDTLRVANELDVCISCSIDCCGNVYINHMYIQSWVRGVTNRKKNVERKIPQKKRK